VIGQRFGNYRAVSLLGEGGMGAVYMAEHPDIGRKVAIKVLRAEFSRDPQLLQRFLNEARAANAIRHPNIIEILDSGTTEEGMPYLVMELLEGQSLNSRIRNAGRLSLKDSLEFAYQTASAVGAAHRKGIVHRDLKPDNIFVVPSMTEPGRELIKVLDFGIAKLLTPGKGESVKTRTGMLMGTPVYMSPEQCLGTKDVDSRSDVYALGLILFEMLCGKPPFFSEGFGELVNLHLNAPPPLPHSIVPDLPGPVEGVVLKALAKKPEERYSTMAELQAALKAAAGPTLILRGSSSPDLVRDTLAGPSASRRAAPTAPPANTLSPAAAHTEYGTTARVGRSRRGPLLVAGLLGLGVAAVGVFVVRRPSADPPAASPVTALAPPVTPRPPENPAPPPPPKVAKVRMRIDTQPSGARILRAATGEMVGTTPFRHEEEAAEGTEELRLEKDGFRTATLTVARGRDVEETVKLEPRAGKKPGKPKVQPKDDEPAKL
jgi:serine/threonine-protein kinase